MITGSICSECERRLVNLYNESHTWLIKEAKKVTKSDVESEDLVSELYIYLHDKCNPKIFWGESYNLYYCNKFLHSRFMNKVNKLNKTRNIGIIGQDYTPWEEQDEIVYDEELDLKLQKAHEEVLEEIQKLKKTKGFASAMIWEMYWMSEDTLDEVAKKLKLSKSTVFLSVRKVRRYLAEIIDNPFK